VQEFEIRTEQALGIIKTHLHPSILNFVESATTPKAALRALKEQFHPSSTTRFLSATSWLFTVKK
jgi:hypothetical protein